ncbi:MAG TPA: lamin tail domain-containing protein, partial [Cyclobacteriaceae bacterium]|nr:lamin tail domain-containing protein [Cyclobacteriaceae bacterium]
AVFPSKIILPNQYLIIVSSSVLSKFSAYNNVLGVPNFPTLNNSADVITFKSSENILIDSINYDLTWYRDQDKQQGGWTLELIDPNNPCGEKDNWTAAEDAKGGTPGKQNSVFASKPDLTGPNLEKVAVLQPNQLLLTFNEKLERQATSGAFTLTPSVDILKASFTDQTLTKIQLDLAAQLQTQKLYLIKIGNVRDCNGNPILAEFSEIKFAVPEPADSLDLVLNEILFNPKPGGFDFVEVYNTSPKYISIKNWQFSNIIDGKVTNRKVILDEDLIIAPYSYLAFTEDLVSLKTFNPSAIDKNIVQTTLPGMSDDEGSIALIKDTGHIIDYFLYSEKFHSELVKDPEGVSLERISFSSPTNDQQNWKSTNSTAGFATPGYVNSNARPESVVSGGVVHVEPQIFTPNSGAQDFAKVNYKFDQSGLIANIKIFDQQGHFIKTLANNETLSYEGFFRWDGDRDDGTQARIGYYLVWFEIFDLSGSVKTFRERVVIAGY